MERCAGLSSEQTAALTLTVSNEHATAAHKSTPKVCFVREWKYFCGNVDGLVSFNFQLLSYSMYVYSLRVSYLHQVLCRIVSVQCTAV